MAYKMSHPPSAPPRRRVVAATSRRPSAELQTIRVVVENDTDPDVSEAFSDRLEEYQDGKFGFLSVQAEADVLIEGVQQTLKSGGCSGVESDDESHLDQIVSDEWAELRAVLKACGVSTEQLPLAADRGWLEWRND